ncbi:MAG TPA: response regulator [Thermomicrobiaceae bacterium]|nr:response regulator [Thermomicrobiaceae bacterium]
MTRILIVEDEHAVAEVLEEFLDTLGFQTETVRDGRQAVDRAHQEPPDLIIMDLMMPRLTGGEAARLLKQHPDTAEIPILAISSVDNVYDLADVLAVDAVLSKPFDLADLESRVSTLLPAADMPASGP